MKYLPATILLALVWTAVLWVFLSDEPREATGFAHDNPALAQPEDATRVVMKQGGDGVTRHEHVVVPGLLLGCSMIAMFCMMLFWSCRTKNANPDTGGFFWNLMWMVLIIYEGAFILLCTTYQMSWVEPAKPDYLGPFPIGTSLMFLGMYGVPFGFIVLYVLFFDDRILPPKSLHEFQQLLVQNQDSLQPPADELVPVAGQED